MIPLPLVVLWLRLNKVHLNADQTKIIIFRSKWKQITKYLNFLISGQNIKISNKVKYLGIKTEQHLNWIIHIKNDIPT